MNLEEVVTFEALAYAADAKLLRVWDDQAKRRDWFSESPAEALESLRQLAQSVVSPAS